MIEQNSQGRANVQLIRKLAWEKLLKNIKNIENVCKFHELSEENKILDLLRLPFNLAITQAINSALVFYTFSNRICRLFCQAFNSSTKQHHHCMTLIIVLFMLFKA